MLPPDCVISLAGPALALPTPRLPLVIAIRPEKAAPERPKSRPSKLTVPVPAPAKVPLAVWLSSPAARLTVPLDAVTVPSLSNGTAIWVLPSPSVLTNVPVLWTRGRGRPKANWSWLSPLASSVPALSSSAPSPAKIVPLCQAIVPWLTSKRPPCSETQAGAAATVSVAPGATVVVPLPVMLPPVQSNVFVTDTAPAPRSSPPETASRAIWDASAPASSREPLWSASPSAMSTLATFAFTLARAIVRVPPCAGTQARAAAPGTDAVDQLAPSLQLVPSPPPVQLTEQSAPRETPPPTSANRTTTRETPSTARPIAPDGSPVLATFYPLRAAAAAVDCPQPEDGTVSTHMQPDFRCE